MNQHFRATVVASLVVLSTVAGVAVVPPPARGASSGEIVDDFEDGDMTVELSNWDGWAILGGTGGSYQATSTDPISGSYSGQLSAAAGDDPQLTATRDTDFKPSNLTWTIRTPGTFDDQKGNDGIFLIANGSGGQKALQVSFASGTKNIRATNTNTSLDWSENTVYTVEAQNINYSAATFDLVINGQSLGQYSMTNGIAVRNSKLVLDNSNGVSSQTMEVDDVAYGTPPSQISGYEVSGTVTYQNGSTASNISVVAGNTSTTTNSSGYYSFGLANGSYTVTADGPAGYQNASKDVTVSGSPRTVDLSLVGNTRVKVVDQAGDPVGGATVMAVAWNNSTFTGTRQQINDKIEDLEQKISDPLPDSWKGRDFDLKAKKFSGTNEHYIALHRSEDWRANQHELGRTGTVTVPGTDLSYQDPLTNNPDLTTPRLAFQPGERIWVSCWDGSKGGRLRAQNGVDEDLPGGAVQCNANITQLAAGDGELSDPQTIATKKVWSSAPFGSEYAGFVDSEALGPGVYEVEPAGGGIAYTFVVAPDRSAKNIKNRLVEELKAQNKSLTKRAQKLQDLAQQDKLTVLRTTTASSGYARLAPPKNTRKLTIQAYKGPDGLSVSGKPTQKDIRDFYETEIEAAQASPGSLSCGDVAKTLGKHYGASGIETHTPPGTVTVEVVSAQKPAALPTAQKLCSYGSLLDLLSGTSLAGGLPNPLEQGRAFLNKKPSTDELLSEARDTFDKAQAFLPYSSQVCARFTELRRKARGIEPLANTECNLDNPNKGPQLGADGVINGTTESGTEVAISWKERAQELQNDLDTTQDRLNQTQAEVADLEQALAEARSDVRTGDETVNEGTNDAGETIKRVTTPINVDLNKDDPIRTVIRYANGTTTTLNRSSDRVRVSERPGGDTVVVRAPLANSSSPSAEVDTTVGTDQGIAKSSTTVRNPSYTGDIPELSSLRVSRFQPGTGETVTVGVNGLPGGNFGTVQAIQVEYPNGTTSTLPDSSDGVANFSTGGQGPHVVRAVFQPAGSDTNFSELITVDAVATSADRPPAIRPQSGPTGRYALVTGSYTDGQVTTEQNGARVTLVGQLGADADAPSRTHLHTQGLDVAPNTRLTYRLTRAPDGQTVDKSVQTIWHVGMLNKDAIIYRNGDQPLKVGGETPAGVVRRSNGTWTIETYAESGTVQVRVLNDPSLVQRVTYEVRVRLAGLSIPFLWLGVPYGPLSGGGVLVLLLATPFGIGGLIRRWRR